jgi:membrane protease subunit HflC
MKKLIIVAAVLVLLGLLSCIYTVPEGEQGVLLKFGQPVSYTTTAGVHWKLPFVTQFHTLPKAQLEWNGDAAEIPTGDRLSLEISPFARWQINDIATYYPALHDVETGQNRLTAVLSSVMRSTVATYPLTESVRSETDLTKTPAAGPNPKDNKELADLESIKLGRRALEAMILKAANEQIKGFGMEVLAFGFKKTGYGRSTHSYIAQRMIAERTQTGKNIMAVAQATAAGIESEANADAVAIVAQANSQAKTITGEAEAKAQELYRKAMSDPDALKFYTLLLQTTGLKEAFTEDGTHTRTTTLFIQGDNPLLEKK